MLVFEGYKIRREATDATLSIDSTCTPNYKIRGPLLPVYSPFANNMMRKTNGVLQLATPQCMLEISTVATAQALYSSDVHTLYEGQDQLQNRAEIVGSSEYKTTHVPST